MTELRRIVDLHRDQVNALVILSDLEANCRKARLEGRDLDAKLAAHDAVGILDALIKNYYSWIFEDLPWTDLALPAQEQTARSRPSTQSVRRRQRIADTLDAGCIVPPELAADLCVALRALDKGEIQDLLAHVPTKQWGNAQEMARARLAALRHVHFLVGKGETKANAQEIVGKAIHKSVAALRSWERIEVPNLIADVPRVLAMAKEAGRVRKAHPDALPTDIDDMIAAMIVDIEDLPLSALQRRLAGLGAKPKVRSPLRNRHRKLLARIMHQGGFEGWRV
ncbi:MAG: hypothetical protein ACK5YI_15695 [Rhodospirillales bacterium]